MTLLRTIGCSRAFSPFMQGFFHVVPTHMGIKSHTAVTEKILKKRLAWHVKNCVTAKPACLPWLNN